MISTAKLAGKTPGVWRRPTYEDLAAEAEAKAQRRNAEAGNLHQRDGIDCKRCKNKGLIYTVEKGELYPEIVARACGCMRARAKVRHMEASGLDKYKSRRLSQWQPMTKPQESMLTKAQHFLSHDGWMYIGGQVGSGKTEICSLTAMDLLRAGRVVLMKSWPELLRVAEAHRFDDTSILDEYKTVDVLYLDDFLKGQRNSNALAVAYELLNFRYNRKLTTIISSELTLAELSAFDEALASRVREMAAQSFLDIPHAEVFDVRRQADGRP